MSWFLTDAWKWGFPEATTHRGQYGTHTTPLPQTLGSMCMQRCVCYLQW